MPVDFWYLLFGLNGIAMGLAVLSGFQCGFRT